MEDKKSSNKIAWIFIGLIICIFLYFVLGECLLPADEWGNDINLEHYQGQWERVLPDGERVLQAIPGSCQAERGEEVILETKLPESLRTDVYLCFRSAKQDMEIYIDGELRQKYSTEETRLFGKTSAVVYLFFKLLPEDAGKTLQLKTQTDSSYSGIFYTVYMGSQMDIWHYYFKQYGAELLVAFLILILSSISIIGSIALRLCYHRKVNLEYLGWGILIAGIWLVSNSVFRQLIFPNLSVINDIAFFMILLLPLPYLLYMDGIQKERYHRGYLIAEVLSLADFVFCAGLHILKWKDFTDTITYMAVVCILTIIFMAATILLDIRRGFIREYRYVAIGILIAFVFAVLQIIIYFNRTSLFNGMILAVGLIILLFFAVISTIGEILCMERAKQQALSASEAKGRFLANMSHEIRTPINAVLGMDAMILRECTEENIKAYALDIKNAGESLLALINDILNLSKIESGKLEIIPAEYDFSSLIHDIMNMITTKAEDKGLSVQLKLDEGLPSKLWGDDVRLRQVLINLLNNAVKYTEQGSVTLTVEGTRNGEKLVLTFSVEDTGIGIRKEDIEKLFAEFERIEEKRNRHIEGTGLGMSITTRLLTLMGSRLQVESEYGKGSKFYFVLEQGVVDEEPIGDLEKRIREQTIRYTYQAAFEAPDAQVLIVDDNAINRRVFINLLKETKIRIEEASSGPECLEMVHRKHYDMIFLDHMMPEMDGIETLHQMQAWEDYPCKLTPVVALTANAVSGAKEMYLEEGFCYFLSKPINPEKLEKVIMETLPAEKIMLAESRKKDEKPEEETKKEELPFIEGIDWEYALLHCSKTEVLLDTVFDFYRFADNEAISLEQFFEMLKESKTQEQFQRDMEQYRIKVHSMKNSAAMIGAVSLAGIARMLEYAARDQKKERIMQMTPVFLEEWQEMKQRLQPFVKENAEEESKPEADTEMTKEYLRSLQEAMEDMDIDTADEIVVQIKRFCYPEQVMLQIENLEQAVANLDAERTADEIKK